MSAPGGGGGCVLPGGVSAPGGAGGVCLLQEGECLLQGGCLLPGGVGIPACTEADTPPVNRITDACKNITLAQLRCGR